MTSEPAMVASSPSRVDGIAVDRTMGAVPLLEHEGSAQVPRIYLQVVDLAVGQEAVANLVGLRPILDIRGSRQPVRKLVALASGEGEVDVAARQTGKAVGQVFELPRDEMDDVPWTAIIVDPRTTRRRFSNRLGQTTVLSQERLPPIATILKR